MSNDSAGVTLNGVLRMTIRPNQLVVAVALAGAFALSGPARLDADPMKAASAAREPLAIKSFSADTTWSADEPGAGRLCIQVTATLDFIPEGWVQANVLVPEGYRAPAHASGQWVSFYFLTHSPSVSLDIVLYPETDHPPTVSFPILLEAGGRRSWLTLHVSTGPVGCALALAQVDASGHPRWFSGRPRSWWCFPTTVSHGLSFVADVLDVEIHTKHELVPWCGQGTSASSLDGLLELVSDDAGCVADRIGEGEYLIRFHETYRGAPDASWFVVRDGDRIHFHATGTPADQLIPAIVEVGGSVVAESPDLADATVYLDGYGTLRTLIERACTEAHPPLAWSLYDGAYHFRLQPEARP